MVFAFLDGESMTSFLGEDISVLEGVVSVPLFPHFDFGGVEQNTVDHH